MPSTIFTAPRFVIFVAGPVTIKAVALSLRRRNAYGNIFNCPAVSCHRMPFKMGKDHIIIIISKMYAHIILRQVLPVCNRERYGAVGILYVHIRNHRITVVFGQLGSAWPCLPVVRRKPYCIPQSLHQVTAPDPQSAPAVNNCSLFHQ